MLDNKDVFNICKVAYDDIEDDMYNIMMVSGYSSDDCALYRVTFYGYRKYIIFITYIDDKIRYVGKKKSDGSYIEIQPHEYIEIHRRINK